MLELRIFSRQGIYFANQFCDCLHKLTYLTLHYLYFALNNIFFIFVYFFILLLILRRANRIFHEIFGIFLIFYIDSGYIDFFDI